MNYVHGAYVMENEELREERRIYQKEYQRNYKKIHAGENMESMRKLRAKKKSEQLATK